MSPTQAFPGASGADLSLGGCLVDSINTNKPCFVQTALGAQEKLPAPSPRLGASRGLHMDWASWLTVLLSLEAGKSQGMFFDFSPAGCQEVGLLVLITIGTHHNDPLMSRS